MPRVHVLHKRWCGCSAVWVECMSRQLQVRIVGGSAASLVLRALEARSRGSLLVPAVPEEVSSCLCPEVGCRSCGLEPSSLHLPSLLVGCLLSIFLGPLIDVPPSLQDILSALSELTTEVHRSSHDLAWILCLRPFPGPLLFLLPLRNLQLLSPFLGHLPSPRPWPLRSRGPAVRPFRGLLSPVRPFLGLLLPVRPFLGLLLRLVPSLLCPAALLPPVRPFLALLLQPARLVPLPRRSLSFTLLQLQAQGVRGWTCPFLLPVLAWSSSLLPLLLGCRLRLSCPRKLVRT